MEYKAHQERVRALFWSAVAALSIITLLSMRASAGEPDSAAQGSNRMKRVELTGQGGWQFGGDIDLDDGDASFDPGPTVGGMFGLRINRTALALLGYHYQFTDVNVSSNATNGTDHSYGMGIGYLQIGGELEFPIRPKVRPVAGVTLGAVHFTPDYDGADQDWFFAAALFGGIKFPILKHLGIRIDMKLLVTVLDNESNSLCVYGVGCATAVDVSAMAQGQAAGGVYLTF